MGTAEAVHQCAMCKGVFPGPGVQMGGEIYCCDKCADRDQNKMHMVAAMAPKVIGVLSVGALLGYLVGRNQDKWF